MAITIDNLQIEIQSNSSKASRNIDKLTESLKNLKTATSSGAGLGAVAKQLKGLNELDTGLGKVKVETENLGASMSRIKTATAQASSKMEEVSQVIEKVGGNSSVAQQEVKQLGKATETAGKQSEKASGGFNKFLASVGRIAMYRAIRAALAKVTEMFREGLESAYDFSKATDGRLAQSLDNLASSFDQLKRQMGAALGELLEALAPIINAVTQLVTLIFKGITALLSFFNGGGSWYDAERTTVAWKETNKEVNKYKKQLLGLDEINNLTTNDDGGSDDLPAYKKNDWDLSFPALLSGVFDKTKTTIRDFFNWVSEEFDALKTQIYNFWHWFDGDAVSMAVQSYSRVMAVSDKWVNTVVHQKITQDYEAQLQKDIYTAITSVEPRPALDVTWGKVRSWYNVRVAGKLTKEFWQGEFGGLLKAIETLPIVSKLDKVWQSVKQWYNENVSGILTKQYWDNKLECITDAVEDIPITSSLDKVLRKIKNWWGANMAQYFTKSYWESKLSVIQDAIDTVLGTGTNPPSEGSGQIQKFQTSAVDYNKLELPQEVTGQIAENTITGRGKPNLPYLNTKEVFGYSPSTGKGATLTNGSSTGRSYGTTEMGYTSVGNNIYDTMGSAPNISAGGEGGVPYKTKVIQFGTDLDDLGLVAASGGYISGGHLFFANENGNPEYIGNMNGTTAVANSDQMSEAIENAAFRGMSAALNNYRENNGGGSQYEPMSGDDLFVFLQKKARSYSARTGNEAFA